MHTGTAGTVDTSSGAGVWRVLRWLTAAVVFVAIIAASPLAKLDSLMVPCAAGVLLYAPFVVAKVLRWRDLLRAGGVAITFRQAWDSYLAGLAFGSVTPGRVGELVRIAGPVSAGHPWTVVSTLTLADRVFDLAAIGLVASGVFLVGNDLPPYVLPLMAGMLLVALAVILVLVRPWSRTTMKSAGWTALSMLLFFLIATSLLRASGADGSWWILAVAVAVGNMTSLVPVSVAGLGTRESAIFAVLTTAGVSMSLESLATYALGFHVVFTATPWLLLAISRMFARHLISPPTLVDLRGHGTVYASRIAG